GSNLASGSSSSSSYGSTTLEDYKGLAVKPPEYKRTQSPAQYSGKESEGTYLADNKTHHQTTINQGNSGRVNTNTGRVASSGTNTASTESQPNETSHVRATSPYRAYTRTSGSNSGSSGTSRTSSERSGSGSSTYGNGSSRSSG